MEISSSCSFPYFDDLHALQRVEIIRSRCNGRMFSTLGINVRTSNKLSARTLKGAHHFHAGVGMLRLRSALDHIALLKVRALHRRCVDALSGLCDIVYVQLSCTRVN